RGRPAARRARCGEGQLWRSLTFQKSGDESPMETARSSGRQLVLVEFPPTPIFMTTLYEHMFVLSRIFEFARRLALGGLSTAIVLDAGRWMLAHAPRDGEKLQEHHRRVANRVDPALGRVDPTGRDLDDLVPSLLRTVEHLDVKAEAARL